MAARETLGFLTESSLLPKRAKAIVGASSGSMAPLASIIASYTSRGGGGAGGGAKRGRPRLTGVGASDEAAVKRLRENPSAVVPGGGSGGAHRHDILVASDTGGGGGSDARALMRRAGVGALPDAPNSGVGARRAGDERALLDERSRAAAAAAAASSSSGGVLELKARIYSAMMCTGGVNGTTIVSSLAAAGVAIHALPLGLRRLVEAALAEEARVLGVESPGSYVAAAFKAAAGSDDGSGGASGTAASAARTAAASAARTAAAHVAGGGGTFLVDFESKRWGPAPDPSAPTGEAGSDAGGALAASLGAAVLANAARMATEDGAAPVAAASGGVRSQWDLTLSRGARDYLQEIAAETAEGRAAAAAGRGGTAPSSLDEVRALLAAALTGGSHDGGTARAGPGAAARPPPPPPETDPRFQDDSSSDDGS